MSVKMELYMNVGKFINDHKLLCKLTLGLAIVGYMGYKAVKWIAVKLGLVKKTDKLAQQTLLPQGTSTIPPQDLKGRKIGVEKPTNTAEILPVPTEEHLKTVQSPKSVKEYLDEEYKGDTSTSKKYRTRLQNIEKHYDKHQIYSVRGDGNGFCNAAVAGLLSIPNIRENIADILRKKLQTDNPNATPYEIKTKFKEYHDFNSVIYGLVTIQNPLENFTFNTAFSRVIRYMLSSASKDLCSPTNGEETGMYAIWVLNDIFNTQAKMIVLEGPKEVDPEAPDSAHVAGGKTLNEGVSVVNFTGNVNSESNKPEFLIIRKNDSFITLT